MLLAITARPAHPSARRLTCVVLTEADIPDIPLLIVDGHNLLFRAGFGILARIWSRDPCDRRDITTQFVFFALLRKAVNYELGTWPEILVVFDGEEGSAERREADPGYKANRPGGDEALRPIRALDDVKAGLDACGITWAEVPDFPIK